MSEPLSIPTFSLISHVLALPQHTSHLKQEEGVGATQKAKTKYPVKMASRAYGTDLRNYFIIAGTPATFFQPVPSLACYHAPYHAPITGHYTQSFHQHWRQCRPNVIL